VATRSLAAIAYVRATPGERRSPSRQLAAIRRHCAARGWPLVGDELDRIAGDPARRRIEPGLARALAAIAEGRAQVLVVQSADRLARSATALFHLAADVERLGGAISSVDDGDDLDTSAEDNELARFLRGWRVRIGRKLAEAAREPGVAAARAVGVRFGAPRRSRIDGRKAVRLRALGHSWSMLARALGCSRSAARRACLNWDGDGAARLRGQDRSPATSASR
jgi:DNA invertase Pin-like site-specific DNA recombinase